ncbi:pilus assembly protein [Endozoicomonas sp.]|uniref:pilus assembly protein n=1 Tax=Endozoicomonas sp. TaxID=1892382 RepID=UPI00288559D8|nr:PilC/PilY family type IV pilus protein [Endozoicomonas sp.]
MALVNQMKPDGWTPLTPTYYDATLHFKKDNSSDQSPINNVCQSNYLVMLSDGEAKDAEDAPTAISNINSLPNISNCGQDSDIKEEKCARTLATWLNTSDLNPYISDQQNVITHTIAFSLKGNDTATNFLTDIAENGGGQLYTADNAADLTSAFNNIITGIIEDESSFVSPGVTANQFNNSRHLSQVYYSVFKPSKTDRWQGNLKRYQLIGDPLDIYDNSSPPALAADPDTGFFKESAFSFWSGSVDGRKVNVGGAGDNIPEAENRKLFTFLGNNPAGQAENLDSSAHLLQTTNDNIKPETLGLPPSDDTRRSELLTWIRDPATWYGDPLHSVPALATYGCNIDAKNCPEKDQRLGIFFGTNDGFIHGLDASTGQEKFAFMPAELLPNLDKLKTNAATDRVNNGRPYGMDGLVTLWVNDLNNNGVIYGGYDTLDFDKTSEYLPSDKINKVTVVEAGQAVTKEEFIYAYIGMRRGGRSYYALDVTAPASPQLRWFISGGDSGFEKLGQTWAKPVKTRIKIGSTIRDVLIFSGGYDPAQDNAESYQSDSMGNAVYIVDAHDGTLIWSASNDRSATLQLTSMNYSIPGGVRVIDLEGDGLADQMFFADTGGQVWRLYINNGMTSVNDLVWPSDSNGDGKWTDDEGVFAELGPTKLQNEASDGGLAQRTHSRKFFVEPDVSLFRLNGSTHLAVAIGSGNRPDPLGRINAVILDRAYSMASPFYANPAVTASNASSRTVPVHNRLQHNSGNTQLVDITQLDSSNNKDIEPEDFFGTSTSDPKKGWFITLEPGEKVMTESVTFEDVIYFNTYLPSNEASLTCNPIAGKARAYAVELLTAMPVKDEDGEPESADRYTNLANSGLPPATSILFPEGSKDALICVGAECNPLEIGDDKQTTYWRQVR